LRINGSLSAPLAALCIGCQHYPPAGASPPRWKRLWEKGVHVGCRGTVASRG